MLAGAPKGTPAGCEGEDSLKRREFILSTGAAAFILWGSSRASSQNPASPGEDKRARICVSSWSFHTLFEQNASTAQGKRLDALDFPEMIADRYRVHNLEIVFPHFASSEPSYVNEFKNRLKKTQSRLVNVPIDYDELWEKPALSAPDPKEREHAISLYMKGIDLAAALGSRTARCDPGTVNLDDPSVTIASYKTLVSYGKSKGVGIIVENHGGISQHPEVLVKILRASGAGALPDIGNFPNDETRERGLRLIFPLASSICHAKTMRGTMTIAQCVQLSKELGFKGVYSIEAGGRGDLYQAVQQVLEELEKCL